MTVEQDRGLVWLLVNHGSPKAEKLAREVIAEQDTATLSEWQIRADTVAEWIEEELGSRQTSEDPMANYPRRGMS